ncbi:MAG TPA: hypothetical protein PLL32_01365 [Anaeromyxobacteraceae bacterium]|nr:hypothetical protein [Anaeromyxobacteraceae bacterium]
MRQTYVLFNPYDDYSAHVIDLVYHKYGLRPVCVYTDRKNAFYVRPAYPVLQSDRIEAEFLVDPGALGDLAAELRRKYDVLGVMPILEHWVEPAGRLSDLLHLDWMPGETVARFRDKHAWKQHLRRHAPHLRVPETTSVRTPEEVLAPTGPAARIRELGDRFVLKPSDGMAAVDVAIFPSSISPGEVSAHMARSTGKAWAMEEFVGGRELAVNGQVGPDGTGIVHSITEYSRLEVNGRATVCEKDYKVDQTDPVFEPLARYALEVVRTLGLRRSPFHLEAKLDDQGPCAIDVGARLVGNGAAFVLSTLHPRRPCLFDAAAHGYLFSDRYGLDEPVDWSWYNGHGYVCVIGVSERDELITSIEGVEEVEALPQFLRWELKPHVGQRVRPTLDLFSIPWDVDLVGKGSTQDLLRVADDVRGMIRWNRGRRTPSAVLRAHGRRIAERVRPRLRWMAHETLRVLQP